MAENSAFQSSLSLKDVGGLDEVLEGVLKLFLHITNPEFFTELKVSPVRGFLLHGPSGCGKTHLARAVAGELNLPFMEIAATELVCGIAGRSESKIRDMFEEAVKCAPSILFIDEIDAVTPKRETTEKGMERRMVAQLLKCFDELNEKDISTSVMVIGATNRLDSMDPALRRGGRFDREFEIGMPDENSRLKILNILCKIKLDPDFNMQWLAHHTSGYCGADLKKLIARASDIGISRIDNYIYRRYFEETKSSSTDYNSNIDLTPESEIPLDIVRSCIKSGFKIPKSEYEKIFFIKEDFEVAIKNYKPYSKREGFATVPAVTWDDVGASEDIKKELQALILWPIKHRELFESSHTSNINGILLYGPRGCGKTLIAQAIANECHINFISVRGAELLHLGGKAVMENFERARRSAPSILFFDELDVLCPTKSDFNVNADAQRVLHFMRIEMDQNSWEKQVFVVGATTKLEYIDSTMLRYGRWASLLYVDLPSDEGKMDILKKITKNKTAPRIADDVSLKSLAQKCKNFSGADLHRLVNKAYSNVIKDYVISKMSSTIEIKEKHLVKALEMVKPSISKTELDYYKELKH